MRRGGGRHMSLRSKVLVFAQAAADERGWAPWRYAWTGYSQARHTLRLLERAGLMKARVRDSGHVEAVRLTKAGRAVVRTIREV